MRRIVVFVLLLCLGLAGCDLSTVVESSVEAPTLPVPVVPEPVVLPGDLSEIPVLTTSEEMVPMIRGPAGTVRARNFLGDYCSDPVYGDLDGDGEVELVYRCPGPTSGLWTEAICVYGLEKGWPVLKGCSVYNLMQIGDFGLEHSGNQIILRCVPQKWDKTKKCYVNKETLRLPLTLAEGEVLANGGELPEGLQDWGRSVYNGCGGSFSALREWAGDEALLNDLNCVVWQRTLLQVLDSDPAGKELVQTCAALTDNGVTVTGFLAFEQRETGVSCVAREGVDLIPAVSDPESFLGLTEMELTERLGECHFTTRLGSLVSSSAVTYYPFCWITEDGKLLQVVLHETAENTFLWDMTSGVPLLEGNLVTVHQEEIPTRLLNPFRWEEFLETAARGEADEVILRLVFDKNVYDLLLRYDGELYTLADEGVAGTYKYLLVSEEDDPRAGARYRRAVHYLLSDDPDLTWEQYMARMFSSAMPPPDQTAARWLFTVYYI